MWILAMVEARGSITVHGPYYTLDLPFGFGRPCGQRNEWFVTRPATRREQAVSDVARITKERCLGRVTRFERDKEKYVVDGEEPFASLEAAVACLIDKWDREHET